MKTIPVEPTRHSSHARTPKLDPRSKPRITRDQLITWRVAQNESQTEFWARFGVTQSRGSRFESGERIPAPVSLLLGLFFNEAIGDAELEAAAGRIDSGTGKHKSRVSGSTRGA